MSSISFLSSGYFFTFGPRVHVFKFEFGLSPSGFYTFKKEVVSSTTSPPRVPVVHMSHLHSHPIDQSSCLFPSAFLRIRLPRTRKTSPPRTRLASLGEEPPSRKGASVMASFEA